MPSIQLDTVNATVPHIVQLAALTTAKIEKNRQTAASLKYTKIYSYLGVAILATLILRNIVLSAQRLIARRSSQDVVAGEKGVKSAGSILYAKKPALLRASDRLDAFLLKPVYGSSWTRIQVALTLLILALNIAFCLVTDVHLITPQQSGSSVARAFSRRNGRIAIANYPFLYCFAGRNNIIASFTGIAYQDLRYYHILLATIAFVQSFIHTIAYTAHYAIWQGMDKLAEEYTEKYFKWGIVAMVLMLTNCVFGIGFIRRRAYEFFLITHIIGAALILAGTWYHRPITYNAVYASVAIFSFERVARLVWHTVNLVNSRFLVRKPMIRATATVCDGAIKLSVPFKGDWQPGAHAYISFWGLDLLTRPHLYGQPHPFSISNVPTPELSADSQELRFVLRIHGGITKQLAAHIERKSAAKNGTADCLVSIEGPHGVSPRAEEYDNVLLIAGGSGITHNTGILSDVCRQAAQGKAVTSNVRLVWALQKESQKAWVEETLAESRAQASKANLALTFNLYITRSASPNTSGASTPTESDEKKSVLGGETVDLAGGKAQRFSGRPDIATEVARVVSDSPGRTLIVACGPSALADEVRRATAPYLSSAVEMEIASFEC